ncbi:MAG: mercuric reductase [Acidobacteriota bacterium]
MSGQNPSDRTIRIEPWNEANRTLVDHVHPSDWRQPTAEGRYHLVVIGAGTAGLVSAAIAASLGAKVALVERHLMGGDCLVVGCVPSKGVIRAARAWAEARRAAERFGAPVEKRGEGDFAHAMQRMREIRAAISAHDAAARFRDLGVDVFLGHARFVAGDAVEVDGQRLEFRRAIVATGARAAVPPIDGLQTAGYRTNDDIFQLTERPERLAVIGGGPIGCELGQAFARFGSRVTIVDRGERILSNDAPRASELVAQSLRADGVELIPEATVTAARPIAGGRSLTIESGGNSRQLDVDEILVAVGRSPNVEDLGLEAAGVEADRGGVHVDSRMQTTNSRIFSIGDVASTHKFTHVADAQARMVVRNALFYGREKVDDLVVPWCTYTDPEVAHVGYRPDDARAAGFEVDTIEVEMADVDRARLDGATDGFLEVYLRDGSDEILGATLVAERAGDMISAVTLAITHGLGLGKFSETIFPYPTQAEILRKAGDLYKRRGLTSTAEKLFDFYFGALS